MPHSAGSSSAMFDRIFQCLFNGTLRLPDKTWNHQVGPILGGISLGRGSQGTSSLPPGSEEFQGIPKVPPSS